MYVCVCIHTQTYIHTHSLIVDTRKTHHNYIENMWQLDDAGTGTQGGDGAGGSLKAWDKRLRHFLRKYFKKFKGQRVVPPGPNTWKSSAWSAAGTYVY